MVLTLINLILTTHLIAFGHGPSQDPCLNSLLPRPKSAVEQVKDLVEGYADWLSYSLERDRNDYANSLSEDDQDIAIHDDPLACRLCDGATQKVLRHLKQNVPGMGWKRVQCKGNSWLLGGFDHYYVYSAALWLIVDPTYRQFLIHVPLEEFESLPRVFVGTPAEYSRLLRLYLKEEEVQLLLKPVTAKSLAKP